MTAGALVLSADASYEDPEQHEPFRISKFYATVDTRRIVDGFREVVGPVSIAVNGVERFHVGWEEWAITARFDTKPYFEQVWQALLCHRSQHAGFSKLLTLPREKLLDLFGEATLVRNYSLVNHSLNEEDLFEGIRTS